MSAQNNISTQAKDYSKLIYALSVVIPLAVAALFFVKIDGYDFTFLPPIYASTNALTAILLVLAFIAIKNKNINLHKKLVTGAIVLSALFLVMYVVYHMTSESTKFGGEGSIRMVYFFILITHILLSIVVIPFVLFTYMHGLNMSVEKHKKIAKITFPLWLYVAVTGVVVYFMISPYYA
jgi:putative membrane protein